MVVVVVGILFLFNNCVICLSYLLGCNVYDLERTWRHARLLSTSLVVKWRHMSGPLAVFSPNWYLIIYAFSKEGNNDALDDKMMYLERGTNPTVDRRLASLLLNDVLMLYVSNEELQKLHKLTQ